MKKLTALLGAAAIGVAALQPVHAQAAQYVGSFELTLTIYVAHPVASGQSVYCLFTVTDKGDPSGSNKAFGFGVATMNAGGTSGTCTALIPYEWNLTNPGANTVLPSYMAVVAPKGAPPAALALAGTGLRFTDLPVISGVPATGSHTNLSATTRM
jgi:hypothetical protein